jgi:hypothetical protein
MPQHGFLIISDINGYSTYLKDSELEHARDSLTSLLKLVIAETRSPLTISKLEGDAVFSYAPKGGFLSGQTLLEIIESSYAAFRRALELMVLNTSCTCNACRNLPNLDLKFFIHFGEFDIQDLGIQVELVGNDVNLVHRLTKNSIREEAGYSAYAAYTQAVIDELAMKDLSVGMTRHRQEFDDVGEVALYVQDMHGIWEKLRDEMRIIVKPSEALTSFSHVFPFPQALVWEYLTKPEYRIDLPPIVVPVLMLHEQVETVKS